MMLRPSWATRRSAISSGTSINLTVDYTGAAGLFDWTFRRMILHYANLCVVAGGVDLFVIGSELRGLEILRGPTWTKSGGVDGSGNAIWDYPMVAPLNALANDVRTTFDSAGFTKNLDESRESHHLFGRLVELDGMAARRRQTGSGRISINCGPIRTSISSASTITCR